MATAFEANSFDLLGQTVASQHPVQLAGEIVPKLDIAWNSFHYNFFSGIPVFFQRAKISADPNLPNPFPDTTFETPIPRGAIIAAVFLHIAILLLPWSYIPASPTHYKAFENTELTWYGRPEDLPLLDVPRAKPKPAAKTSSAPDTNQPADEAFHPRQSIVTDPVHPTHPRQTLINPAVPPDAPKFLPEMPNIVQVAATNSPARPRMEISSETLAKLHPKAVKSAEASQTSTPDLPNLEQHVGDINLATSTSGPAKPKLSINATSAPRLGEKNQSGEAIAAPEVSAAATGGNAPSTLIALSASPGPAAPIQPPQGNLAARMAVSPEGSPGAAGTSGGNGSGSGGGEGASNGSGKNSVGISISGGTPKSNSSSAGLGAPLRLSIPKSPMKRPDPNADDDPPERTGPPNFAILTPGAKPEQIFGAKRVYTLNINMPNVNSATGSWIIHFSELRLAGGPVPTGTLSTPTPVRKIDPKYPQTLQQENIQGEVVLYAVIRKDGSVDSIQKVRGIDDQLDANAIAALAQWKFQPAMKGDTPVDLEAIVYIPFKAPPREREQ